LLYGKTDGVSGAQSDGLDNPRLRGNCRQQYSEVARKSYGYRGDGAALNYEEQRPTVQKTPQRGIRFTQINILAASAGKHSRQFSARKGCGDRKQAGDDPRQQQAARGTGLAGDVRRDDKNSRADHRADDDHGAVEEADGPHETSLTG
jgi:hypothetical protein